MNKLARIISTIFIPPTLTVLSFVYLAVNYETETNKKILVILVSLLFGFAFQIGMFMYFYNKKIITDVDATKKIQRTIPYYASITIFAAGLIILILAKVNTISIAFWFCYISNTFLVILINRYLKISIHAMGVSGPLALFVFLIGLNGLFLLPILAAVCWSRIKLKVHTLYEVTAGSIFGFISGYLQLSIFLN